ncbi:hypothetical protein J2W18_004685 [Rhodococcus cercidiphylli]|nr:hypothetical protein [Rhodococcus cercidiphylli]
MSARLNPMPVIYGHARTLVNGTRSDYAARFVLWGAPVLVGLLSYLFAWRFTAPSALLTGAALLMSGFLTTAGALSTFRLKLTDRDEMHRDAEQAKRNLDEAVPQVLVAALGCLVTAVLVIIAMNFPVCPGSATINRGFSASLAGVLSFVALLFVATIVRLYAAYVQVNRVSDDLNGFVRHHSI